jgi:hypothetical protein
MEPKRPRHIQLRPGSTPAAQARHALRYLHDAAELRRNPLAAPFFRSATDDESGVIALRAVIRAALAPASRALRIVQECDFASRPHKAVQFEMHISERQFYRDRSHAFAVVAGALARHPAGATSRDADLALKIDFLTDLLDTGDARAVAGAVDQTLHAGVPVHARARLHALSCGAALCRGDDEAAQRDLAAAVACAEQDPVAVADCRMAQSRFDYVDGRVAEAVLLVEDAVRVTRDGSLRDDPIAVRAHVRHLRHLARLHEESNDPRTSLDLLNDAKALLVTRTHGEHALLAVMKIDAACAALALPDHVQTAFAELADAHALACRAGAPHLLAWVECLTGCAKMTAGMPGALEHARLAVTLARSGMCGEWLARALNTISRVFAGCGEPARALELVDEGHAHVLLGRYIDAISGLRRAVALHALARHRDAANAAETACERIAAVNSSHFLGSAHLVAAASHAALGNPKRARAHLLDAALPILAASGFALDYLKANELALRLTGEQQYERRVAELTTSLIAS